MNRTLQYVGFLTTFFLIVFFVYWLFNNFRNQDLELLCDRSTILSILMASVLYAVTAPVSSFVWKRLLLIVNCDRPFMLLMAILCFTQFAKYVPGNIFQFAGRAFLSIKNGVKTSQFVMSIGMETLLGMLSCIFVAFALGLLFSFPGEISAEKNSIVELLLYVLIISISLFFVGVLVFPRAFARLLDLLTNFSLADINKTASIAVALYSINYLLIGLGMWVISLKVLGSDIISYSAITIAFCIAWLVGAMTPGAPAGLGSREAVLLVLIHPVAPDDVVLPLIISFRITTLVGDLLCFIAGSILLRGLRE